MKKLQASVAETIEPIIHDFKPRAERVEKLESRVREMSDMSDNGRLQQLEAKVKKVD